MSKRQSKTGVQHQVYQAKTGFQYYFTFPSYIGNHPQLPAQIRWSLGHDEALARDLAQYLNRRFDFCSVAAAPRRLNWTLRAFC